LHVYHLRRSGGHGVIDWLLKHQAGNKVHYNQVVPISPGYLEAPCNQICQFPGDAAKPLFELISFEDLPLDLVAAKVRPPRQAVLMLRDPFNTFASRLRNIEKSRGPDAARKAEIHRIDPALWKQYAREFLNPRYLPHAVRLNFNVWYVSASYRRYISEQLGWTFTDQGFGSTSGWKFSQGSSFGDRDPKHLDLFNRWRVYRDDAQFQGYFDDEMRQLSAEIFDFAPQLDEVSSPPLAGASHGDEPTITDASASAKP
jgi:hypothetical protein